MLEAAHDGEDLVHGDGALGDVVVKVCEDMLEDCGVEAFANG